MHLCLEADILVKVVLLNSKTGEQLTMPVTPSEWHIEVGRSVESLDMSQTGQVNLSGLSALFNEQSAFLLPSSSRNYADPGYSGNPFQIVDTLTRWSSAGDVLRLIITDTPVNVPILLAPVRYGQQDGTGDVYVTLTMRQYRELTAEIATKSDTGNAGRTAPQTVSNAADYTVVKGDTLWGIARKYYGNGQLAWKLASYNGIKNANLIYPGQRVRIPDQSQL